MNAPGIHDVREWAVSSAPRATTRVVQELGQPTARPAAKLDDVSTAVAHTITELIGVSRCAVFVQSTADRSFRARKWLSESDYTAHLRGMVNGADPFTAEIVERREPVVIADSLSDPRVAQHYEISRRCHVRSMLGIPLTSGERVIGVAFIDDVGQLTRFSDKQVRTAMQLTEMCGVALEQAAELQRSLDAVSTWQHDAMQHRQLLAVTDHLDELISNKSAEADDLALAGAAALSRPVEIVDSQWNVVAQSQPHGQTQRRTGQLSDVRIRQHAKVKPLLARLTRDGQPCVIPPMPALGLDLRCLVAPVHTGSQEFGYLVVHESGHPFTAFDHRAATSIAGRTRMASLATKHEVAGTQSDRNALLAAALRDIPSDDGARTSVVGDSAGSYVICVFGGIGLRSVPEPAYALAERMSVEAIGDRTAARTEYDGRLVVLLPVANDAKAVIDRIRPLIDAASAEFPALQRLTLGISRTFDEPTGCLRPHDEALQVLRAMRTYENPDAPRVITADEFGASLTYLASADVGEARRVALDFAHSLLEQANSEELIHTLRVFLQLRNVVKCARTLGVHDNTVRYRLSKIAALTGEDVLTDPDSQVRASLSVQVLRMSGDCRW